MRIVRYAHPADGRPSWGILENDAVIAADGVPWLGDGLRRGEEIGRADSLRLLAPVDPGKIICIGLNYLKHVTERDPTRVVPTEPVIFWKPNSAIIGPGETIRIANPGNDTHYEAELAMIVGTGGRDIPEGTALDHVFGYTCANDVSDRVLQKKDGQFVRAKGFHTYCPVGPWIETDLDPNDLPVRSRLNGELRQDQRTSAMLFGPAFLVSFISGIMTLDPGDLILTGTPENVGALAPGDTIEVEVGGIGVLSNPVGLA
jgi:2-keto-4-pentenoate hydratase/2-oxohepta-3-ene-1,7-dioic acid hydratase in catechol pathway